MEIDLGESSMLLLQLETQSLSKFGNIATPSQEKYLTRRGYHPNNVHKQFNKAKSISIEELLQHSKREKIILFPLVVDFNPRLPATGKILKKHFHFIQDSSELQEIFQPTILDKTLWTTHRHWPRMAFFLNNYPPAPPSQC